MAVDSTETHISLLFFAGERAYKLLKPVTTHYLDFSTTKKRLEAVDDEIELNRRLSPDVYLGHADVVESGEVVDRMIVMRRLPAERRLNRLLWSADADDIVRSVARAVAAFHASLEPLYDVADIAGSDAVRANWNDNHAEIGNHVGTLFQEGTHEQIVTLVDRYIGHHQELFDRRIEQGHIRECHGDLTADDIFHLDDGPRILDCLAFSRRLRVSDVLADIGFLAMDLDRLAGPELSRKLMHWYAEYSGEHHSSSLAHHYVAYRAHVRAKVEALRHVQGDGSAAGRSRRHLDVALDHLNRAQLKLVLVGGAPGTGKTTLAEALSQHLGFLALDSDTLRKDLSGRAHDQPDPSPLGQGSHSPAFDDATYKTLLSRAGTLLGQGESVLVDASWSSSERREAARALAADHGAVCVELECDSPPDIARERVTERLRAGGHVSDARPELLDALRQGRHPWPEARRISTTGPAEKTVTEALEIIDRKRFPTSSLAL
jgi:aminoglycoside phosphotransferase family enzyme/adenylate kinase family enzyme